jgi:hypothetical protein
MYTKGVPMDKKELKNVINDLLIEEGVFNGSMNTTITAVNEREQISTDNIDAYKEQIKLLKKDIKELEKLIKSEQDDIKLTKEIKRKINKLES